MSPSPGDGHGAGAPRIVVFTGSLNHGVRKGIAAIEAALPGAQWLVCVQTRPRTLRGLWRGQKLNLKRSGWRWIPYQMRELSSRALGNGRAHEPQAGEPGHEFSLSSLRSRPGFRIETGPNLHAPEFVARVHEFAPDLGLSLGGPILKRALFAIPRLGTINLHKGKLPEFRGMPPAFWELWHDQPSVGCSVHVVDDGLDTGALLGETMVARQRYSTVKGLQLELDEVAIELTRDCALAVLGGHAQPRPQPTGQGRTFRKPSLQQEAQLQERLRAQEPATPRWRNLAKDAAAVGLATFHRLGGQRLLAPRVAVFNYHRVTDEVRDNLTIGIEHFDRHMAWAAAHCTVLPIEEVLAMDRIPRSDRPLVCITFDDGYLDNFRHAAPILRRHGLPASFFVSTGIVDSERPFPHDVRRKNPPIPNMTWEQLDLMRRWGFTIGSHTVNHIDCAAESEDVVRRELAQSRDDLRRELGVRDLIFAYPYGGRQHMTVERLDWVRDAGYVGCLSAFGGVNVGGVDRWMVLRCSDGWAFSDRSFQRRCLGLA